MSTTTLITFEQFEQIEQLEDRRERASSWKESGFGCRLLCSGTWMWYCDGSD